MNDASLDREIESLLGAEPSPEFVARVRARVAEEPTPGTWRASWMFVSATAVAAIVITVVVWPSRDVTSSSHTPVEPQRVTESVQAITPSPVPAPHPVPRPPTVTRVGTVAVEDRRAIDIDLPEVMLADNEVRTFAALVASIRQRRFDAAVPTAPNPDAPLEIKELPPVEPLEIEPIVRVAVLQTEGERP